MLTNTSPTFTMREAPGSLCTRGWWESRLRPGLQAPVQGWHLELAHENSLGI